MKRREFIKSLGGALVAMPQVARAQVAKPFRVGSLTPGSPIAANSTLGMVLLKGLEQQGLVLGKNLIYDARGAAGQNSKLPELVRAMKTDYVDVIVAVGYPTARACKDENLPTVVAWGSGDPVATRLVDSLAHPGGSITGIADNATALSTKRLDLIKQAVPDLKQVAMLWNRDDLGMSMRFEASAEAARSIGVTVQALGVREPDDFAGVFEAMDRTHPDAIMMVSDSLTILNRKRVFDYAAAHRIPALYEYDVMSRDGGLMSYGPDLTESVERAADLIGRIIKGARPADLPFEQPTRYLFVVNLKVAKASSIELPVNLVALADEVID